MYLNEIEITVSIKIDNIVVNQYIESVTINLDESNYVNTVEINFNNDSWDLFNTLCNPDTAWGTERIKVTLNSYTYNFLLETRTTNVTSTTKTFSIWGRSKGALLDLPFAEPIIDDATIANIWQENPRMASEIISTLMTGTGISYEFNIDDFPVYVDNFTVQNDTPIQIINNLVAVPGGRIRSKPDGNLILEYKPYNANLTNPTIEFTDLDDILQLDEEVTNPIGYNKVKVSGYDAGGEKSITIELAPDQDCLRLGFEFKIRVFLSPSDMTINFDTSSGTSAKIGTYDLQLEYEEIDFTEGKGNTKYPIKTLDSYEWYGNDLGTPNFDVGYNGITITEGDGFGVLYVTYTTQYDLYTITVNDTIPDDLESASVIIYAQEQISG